MDAFIYIVTVRTARNPEHDPQAKKTGRCPFSAACTDVTGEHHSFLAAGQSAREIAERYRRLGHRVTRVEHADPVQ